MILEPQRSRRSINRGRNRDMITYKVEKGQQVEDMTMLDHVTNVTNFITNKQRLASV